MISCKDRFNRWLVYVICLSINVQPALAEVIVSSSNTQVSNAANGVEVVNIATPNSAGLSHNRYEKFNVDASGLILNNSTQTFAKSQLGGILERNENLGNKAANVILNEVTSANRSQLKGYTEVFGSQANVVIANPYGITCNGCGFINTPRVTLSTGIPLLKNDTLDGFSVSQGDITIEGQGLDASGQSYFDIITRAAQINADIHAQELNIITGTNDVSYKSNKVSRKAVKSEAPSVAIDSSSLGGMYAGRIQLVSTESGVGVNSGNLSATAGDIVISSDGTVTLGNSTATNILSVTSTDKIVANDRQYAANSIHYSANQIEGKAATISAKNDITFDATKSVILSDSQITSGLSADGTLSGRGELNVKSDSLSVEKSGVTATGSIISQNQTVSVSDNSQLQADNITFNQLNSLSNGGNIQGNTALSFEGAAYTLSGKGQITSSAVHLLGGDATIHSQILGESIDASLTNALNLASDGKLNASHDLTVATEHLTNSGVLQATDNIELNVGSFDNRASLISAGEVEVTVQKNVQNKGLLYSNGNTQLHVAGNVVNQQGEILVGGNLSLDGKQTNKSAQGIYNRSGNIEAKGAITLNANQVENTRLSVSEKTTSESGNAPKSITEKKIAINSGDCFDAGHDGRRYRCRFGYSGIHEQRVASKQSTIVNVVGESSRLTAGSNINISANQLTNSASLISSNDAINISVNKLNNRAYQNSTKTVMATYDAPGGVTSSSDTNYIKVKVTAKRKLTTTVEKGRLYNSSIIANGNLTINASSSVNNGTTKNNAKGSGLGLAGAPEIKVPENQNDNPFISDNDVAFPHYTIPDSSNGLFLITPDPKSHFLIETNPLLTDLNHYLGSDYFLKKLDYKPDDDLKFLGDAYYDTRAITQAIFEQTGQRYLNTNIGSDLQQMQALIDAASTEKDALQLEAGVALTNDQIDHLTHDIIWYENATVNGQKVLVPKLYLAAATKNNLGNDGALISGKDTKIAAKSITNNEAAIQASGDLELTATDNISNRNGTIGSAGDLTLVAENDISNINSELTGDNVVVRSINGNVSNQTEVERLSFTSSGKMVKNVADTGSSDVTTYVAKSGSINARGKLVVDAGRDLIIDAANVNASGDASLNAGNSVYITTAKNKQATSTSKGRGYTYSSSSSNVTSAIHSGGNLSVSAGNDIVASGANVSSVGNLALKADRDISFDTAIDETYASEIRRGYQSRTQTKTHHGVSLSGDNISVESGRNISMTSANIDANDSVALASAGDITLQAANDRVYHYDKKTKKKSFGRKKTTINERLNEESVGSSINAANITVVAQSNKDNQKSAINLVGSDLNAKENVKLIADGDVTLSANGYRNYQHHESKKSGFGGLTGKSSGSINDATLLSSANVITGRDVDIQSGKDIGVIASNVDAGGQVSLDAANSVEIGAGQVERKTQQWSQKSSLFSGNIYSMVSHQEGETSSVAQGSSIRSGSDLSVDGASIAVIGSDLAANGGAKLTSESGDITVAAATNNRSSYAKDEELSVNFGDVGKLMTQWSAMSGALQHGQFNATVAKASYDKVDQQTTSVTHKQASIAAQGNVTLDSHEAITISGANIAADTNEQGTGDVTLAAGGDVTVREVTDTTSTTGDESHAEVDLSISVKHQAVEVVHAAEALKKSKDALVAAKASYQDYKSNLAVLNKKLAQLKEDYRKNASGVDTDDIDDLAERISDAKSDEAWYLGNITLATADVASKTTLLVKQTATAAQSASTYGFDVGLDARGSLSKTSSSSSQTQSIASNVSGNNISVLAGKRKDGSTAEVRGSNISATNRLSIEADNIKLLASQDTSTSHSTSENGSVDVSITLHGASTGPNVNVSTSKNTTRSDSTNYTNSVLKGGEITLASTRDTTIHGANVTAENVLNVDAGGDLNVVSVQNSSNSSSKGAGLNAGLSITGTGAVSGISGGINASGEKTKTKQTLLSSLTSGGTATVNVGNNTDISGAVIATTDQSGQDTGLLALTTNTLTHSNLGNTQSAKKRDNGISTNLGKGKNGLDATQQTTSIQLQNTSGYSKTKTLATLGNGNIQIHDESNSSVATLNRDVTQTQKDLFSVERQQGNADVTIDNRILTKEGRASIAEDAKRTELGGEAIADVVTKSSVDASDTFEHMEYVQKDLDVQIQVAKNAKDAAIDLNNLDTSSAEQKQKAIDVYAAAYARVLGLSIDSARVIAIDRIVNGAQYNDGTRTISKVVINDESMANAQEYMQTLAHELSHVAESQGVIDNKGSERENYADLVGNYAAENYAWALEHSELGEVKTGDVNAHIGNDSDAVQQASSEYLADEARLGSENINYSLSRKEMTEKIAALRACSSAGVGSEACATVDKLNILDATRDLELQKACQDISSDACKTQLTKTQENYDSYNEDAEPFEDTKYGQERESIYTVLQDPSGKDRQQQYKDITSLFSTLVDFVPVVGDIKGLSEAKTGVDYLFAVVGFIPGVGDLVGKAAKAMNGGDVKLAQKYLSQAQKQLQEHPKLLEYKPDGIPNTKGVAQTTAASKSPVVKNASEATADSKNSASSGKVAGGSDVVKGTAFQKAVGQLSEVGQQNVRTLQGWAKSKGWVRKSGDGPEVWGVKDANGNFSWRLKVKPEASNRQGLKAGSNQPRFDARLDSNGTYINPFTDQIGTKAIGTHIPLEKVY